MSRQIKLQETETGQTEVDQCQLWSCLDPDHQKRSRSMSSVSSSEYQKTR